MPTTADELLEILDTMVKNPPARICQRCMEMAKQYKERIEITRAKEKMFRDAPENSDEERRCARMVSQSVRLEATTARRMMLHLIADHNK